MPEIRHYAPDTPFILVANKVDLRSSPDWESKYKAGAVTAEEGAAMAKKLGAVAFMECSALKQNGMKDVFDKAIGVGLTRQPERRKKKKSGCAIL